MTTNFHIQLKPNVIAFSFLVLIFSGSCNHKKTESQKVSAGQPVKQDSKAVFIAAGIGPSWKLALFIAPDSTFFAEITKEGTEMQKVRVIPFTEYPSGPDRPNDIFKGTIGSGDMTSEITIKIVADECGGVAYESSINAGCRLITGVDTLSGCGRWFNARQ